MDDNLIRIWSVSVPKETIDELKKTLDSNWLNTGKKEKEFREKVKEKFNAKYAIACNSGTSALKISLSAAGVRYGDEVITTPYTFIATNTSILEVGAKPVFADIDYNTLNISPRSIYEKVTKKTKAIMVVHYGGLPVELNEIRDIGRYFKIPIIEDSAQAMGSKYNGFKGNGIDGDYIGSKGDLIAFSLQVIKIITCGDGGIVTTTNEEYYKRLKEYAWFGVDREDRIPNAIDPLSDDIIRLGYKANMNDITATIACVAINNIDEQLEKRQTIGNFYRNNLKGLKKLTLIKYPEYSHPNYQMFPVHIENRERFAEFMLLNNIQVIINRRNDKYSIFGGIKSDLPGVTKADEDVVLLPCHSGLDGFDLFRIMDKIHKYDKL